MLIEKKSIKYHHQHDINGCGIACLANLLNAPYQEIKQDFETKFYKINKGIKVFDIVNFLQQKGLNYQNKFFNHNSFDEDSANKFSLILNSIILIRKNETYPIGHYLLRVENGWIDSWLNFPSINNVHAGIREALPGNPWYVIYPADK